MTKVYIIREEDIPPNIEGGVFIPIYAGYGVELKSKAQVNEQDKWLLTDKEWEDVEDDSEDIMIAQHNKTLQSVLSRAKRVDIDKLAEIIGKNFESEGWCNPEVNAEIVKSLIMGFLEVQQEEQGK